MRIYSSLLTLTLALAPTAAAAQATTAATEPPATSGRLDVGARGTDVKDDGARYQRYRDLRDGVFFETLRWDAQRADWFVNLGGDHIGYRDQRFMGAATKPGRAKVWFTWDQIPMLMSNTTRTLFVEDVDNVPAALTLDPAFKALVQATAAATPNTTAVAQQFANFAKTFDMRTERKIALGGVEVIATPELTFRAGFQHTNREGAIPYGGAFGHSSLVELPAPIQHTTNEFDSAAEFQRGRVLVRAGFNGSWFTNDHTTVSFENPFRSFDQLITGSATSSGAAAAGRLSLAPSNSFVNVNALASVKLPARSRVSWSVSVGSLKDAGDPIMPQTINALNQGLIAALPRERVEGEARTLATNLSFISRPSSLFDVSFRYRTYDYDNRTPEFDMTQRVAYDNSPGSATMSTLGGITVPGPVPTEPFGVVRHTLDADARVSPVSLFTAGVGYSWIQEERNHRFFEKTTENLIRVSFDAVGHQFLTLRTKYEHSQRRGDVTEEAEEELFNIGEQPFIRHFDIAERDRDRVTILGAVTPLSTLSLTASAAVGKDDYIESIFGLRDNTHRVYSVGLDATPTETATFGVSYNFERYKALSRSRQANPPSGAGVITFAQYLALIQGPTTVQVADASRNWATNSTDRVHSVQATVGLQKIAGRLDVDFTFDTSRSRGFYDYITGPVEDRTLPEEVILDSSLTNCNTPGNCNLPVVTNTLERSTLDLVYWLNDRFGIGASHWYERYKVTDFTLDADATPDLVRSQAVLVGYLYRPYTANTVWGRLIVRW